MGVLLSESMNEDSTWTFIMFADSLFAGAFYTIDKPLYQKHGEESAKEVFDRWNNCFVGD